MGTYASTGSTNTKGPRALNQIGMKSEKKRLSKREKKNKKPEEQRTLGKGQGTEG